MSELKENDFPPLEPHPFLTEKGREIERLRAELAAMQKQRDEARRWVCRLLAYPTLATGTAKPYRGTAQCFAKEQGWDCFEEGGGA